MVESLENEAAAQAHSSLKRVIPMKKLISLLLTPVLFLCLFTGRARAEEERTLVHVHDTFIKSLENGQFSINVIMEYCEGGNLEQLNYKNNPLPEDVCTFLLYLMS